MSARAAAAPLFAVMLATTACQAPRGGRGPAVPANGSPVFSPGTPAAIVDDWLRAHPTIAASIAWQTPQGVIPWASWPGPLRQDLGDAFGAAVAGLQNRSDARGFPLRDPPPNLSVDARRAQTVLTPEDAWRLYVAHVGHSLALEYLRAVPWSVASDPPNALATLFDGRSIFEWKPDARGYLLPPSRAGYALPAPPGVEYGFLLARGLLGPTRRKTIENVVAWASGLRHLTGAVDADNTDRVWQYRGAPPVSRILAGTVARGAPAAQHHTAGCWGTTGLLVAVLRAANIPVRLMVVGGQGRAGGPACPSHAQPSFISEHLYLSHADDAYNRFMLSLGAPALTAQRLLIDEPTWQSWFGESVAPEARCANIGRQPREIALAALPHHLVELYCEDQRQGIDRRAGKVARAFGGDAPGSAFPIARLEGARLWERLADQARAAGGCGAVLSKPPPHAHRSPRDASDDPAEER